MIMCLKLTRMPVGGFDFTTSVAPNPDATVERGWHLGVAGIYGGAYTQWTKNLQQGGDAWEFGATVGGTMALGTSVSLFYVFSGIKSPYITDGDPRSAFKNLDLLDRAIMMNEMREDTGAVMLSGSLGSGAPGAKASIGFLSMYGFTANMLLGM